MKLSIVFGLLSLAGVPAQIFGADVAGIWTGRVVAKTADGRELQRDVTLKLEVTGSKVTGTLSGSWEGHHDEAELLDGKLSENMVSFAVASGASDVSSIEFVGKQDGNDLKLTVSVKDPSNGQEWKFGDWLLQRAK